MKTLLAPGLKARMLGIEGWYSTNILGNRDGEVLDDPESLKTKEVSKLGVLDNILQPHLHPDLYGNVYHKVQINYYPPRGDNKEGWDNVDIFGWLGYQMQIKVNFLCRDSILAAPVVLDLALFLDLAQRSGMKGVQEWLSFYWKSPHDRARAVPRARRVHPADEAEEHAPAPARRGPHHAPRASSTTTEARSLDVTRPSRVASASRAWVDGGLEPRPEILRQDDGRRRQHRDQHRHQLGVGHPRPGHRRHLQPRLLGHPGAGRAAVQRAVGRDRIEVVLARHVAGQRIDDVRRPATQARVAEPLAARQARGVASC